MSIHPDQPDRGMKRVLAREQPCLCVVAALRRIDLRSVCAAALGLGVAVLPHIFDAHPVRASVVAVLGLVARVASKRLSAERTPMKP